MIISMMVDNLQHKVLLLWYIVWDWIWYLRFIVNLRYLIRTRDVFVIAQRRDVYKYQM